MTELMRHLAVFLEMCKNRSGEKKGEEKQNRWSIQIGELYLSSNSLKVQSSEPTSVVFLTLVINYLSLDVPVKTRTCRSCNVNISSHLAKNCMC